MSANLTTATTSRQGKAAEGGAGLVPYTTTVTRVKPASPEGPTTFEKMQLGGGVVVIDHDAARLARMKHHVRTAGRLVKETMARDGRKWRSLFVTLTYRDGRDWRPEHVSQFIRAAREWARRRGAPLRYVWVAELQKRGAIHYHLCIWLPSRLRMPSPDKRGWWPHGSTNVQTVKRNSIGYLMKYVSKGGKLTFPKGARICASGGLDTLAAHEFHYWRMPRYVREHMNIGDRARRVAGGGWVIPSGQILRSAFGVAGHRCPVFAQGEKVLSAETVLRRIGECEGRATAAQWDAMLNTREAYAEQIYDDSIRVLSLDVDEFLDLTGVVDPGFGSAAL